MANTLNGTDTGHAKEMLTFFKSECGQRANVLKYLDYGAKDGV